VVIVLPVFAVGWIILGVVALAEEARSGPISASPSARHVPPTTGRSARPRRAGRVDRGQSASREYMDDKRVGLNAWLAEHEPTMKTLGYFSGFVVALLTIIDHL
jgi:hypothetical protein